MSYVEEVWDLASQVANFQDDELLWNTSDYVYISVPARLIQRLWWATRCDLDVTKTGIKRSWTFQEAIVYEVMGS